MTGVLCDILGDDLLPNTEELLAIYGRVMRIFGPASYIYNSEHIFLSRNSQMIVNAFNILDQELNSIATGIYLGVSITDHSCKPNAVATFDGTTLFIRTIEDLPSIDWSKVRHIDQIFSRFFYLFVRNCRLLSPTWI